MVPGPMPRTLRPPLPMRVPPGLPRRLPQRLPSLPLLTGAVLLAGAGCSGGTDLPGDPIPVEAPATRSGEDLLGLPETMEILELQLHRDGPGLAAYLDHPEGWVRSRAALALASVQDPELWGALEGHLDDPVASVRRDAAFALGQIPLPDGGVTLLRRLQVEEDPEVRLRLVEALGKQGGDPAAEGLLELDPAPDERAARILALGRLGIQAEGFPVTGVVAELARSLYSGDERVREAGAWFFGRSPSPHLWVVAADVVREAMDLMPDDTPALMHLAVALGRLRDPADGPRLLHLLERGGDWRIRTNAARALGNPEFLEAPGTRDALWRAIEGDPSEHVATAATEALTSGFQVAEADLARAREWLRGDPTRWRTHVPFLRPLVTWGDPESVLAWTRRQAGEGEVFAVVRGLEVVGAMTASEAVELLFELADHGDPEIREAAVRALAGRWPRDVGDEEALSRYADLFGRELTGDRPRAAAAAAEALGNPTFRSWGASPLLAQAWEARGVPHLEGDARVDPPVLHLLETLLRAMGESGDPDLLPLLDEALTAPDHRIRRAAAGARRELTGQEVRGLNLPDPERGLDADALAALGAEPELVLETDRGRLVVRLAPDQAPLTVLTVAELAAAGAYDGTRLHRVIGNFVVQGGDVGAGDGSGGPGYAIRSEFTQIPFLRGVLGMASSGKDTEGSQFFLTHSMQPHLDGGYTAFGWVTSGEEVLDALLEGHRILEARVRPASGSRPDPGAGS
jgi:cyclophilin family peptidyl-prolyl cis-trans isomerase